MREADEKLMKQMGAVLVEESKVEIQKIVLRRIDEFEQSLGKEQKEYMDFAFKERDVSKCKIVFPFLRSTHKVQKMSEEEIRSKNIENIKFRPVIDARRWATRGYAALSMKMMRKCCKELLEVAGTVMGEMKVKNGWEFSLRMQDYKFKEELEIMFSADLEEAYTNVTAGMINKAIEEVSRYLGYPGWRVSLMQKLINLVLGNNFVETSTGVYIFKMVLPMGYKLSGEALDIVGMAGEMSKLINLGKIGASECGTRIAEITDYPEDLVERNVQTEVKMARGVKTYKRYVDDTFGIVGGNNIQDVIDGILAVGFMFPAGLVINLEMNIRRAEFLDVFCWRELSGNEISTMMKRNAKVPFGHVRNGSDHPCRFKLQSLLGEMLRNRRISSDEEVVEVVDQCIVEDLISIGYTRRIVEQEKEKSLRRKETGYGKQFVKNDEEERKRSGYGGSIVYNGHYQYNRVLEEFLERIRPEEAGMMTLKPGTKLKSIVFTKRRYLKRQKMNNDMNK